MDYTLQRASAAMPNREGPRRKIVPPKPGKGERKPRAYSPAELNALWATSHSLNWQAMVTLNPPPTSRIATWPELRSLLEALKTTLTNWHRRMGFPIMMVVTEFDPASPSGEVCANLHIGCAHPLTDAQQKLFCTWWLKRFNLQDNRGGAFQHDAKGGGPKLQAYLAKDLSRRNGHRRLVKYAAPWLPARLETHLWFIIGAKRHPAREGAKLRAQKGLRRCRFDSEHGNTQRAELTASTGTPDSEHASTFITPEPISHAASFTETSHGMIMPSSSQRQECQICRNRWGKSLWVGSCKCIPGFPFTEADSRPLPWRSDFVSGLGRGG